MMFYYHSFVMLPWLVLVWLILACKVACSPLKSHVSPLSNALGRGMSGSRNALHGALKKYMATATLSRSNAIYVSVRAVRGHAHTEIFLVHPIASFGVSPC